jgi:hypothetical protein
MFKYCNFSEIKSHPFFLKFRSETLWGSTDQESGMKEWLSILSGPSQNNL